MPESRKIVCNKKQGSWEIHGNLAARKQDKDQASKRCDELLQTSCEVRARLTNCPYLWASCSQPQYGGQLMLPLVPARRRKLGPSTRWVDSRGQKPIHKTQGN